MIFQKKKKPAHAYFRAPFFLSLLAGKFSAFEQMLLTEPIFLKKAHAYCEHRIFFFSVFWRENSKLLNSP